MKEKSHFRYAAALLAALLLVSGGAAIANEAAAPSFGPTAPEQVTATPAPFVPTTRREKLLQERVLERWEALRVLDMKKVYAFATPAYREAYDQRHMSLQYSGQIERLDGKIYSVTFDQDDPNTARVKLEIRFRSLTAVRGRVFEDNAWIDQTWVYDERRWWQPGQWYHVEPK